MANHGNYNWGKFVRIESDWVKKFLNPHVRKKEKIMIRCFNIKFSGTQQRYDGLITHIASQLDKFVFSETEKKEFEKTGKNPYREALQYFGGINPDKDGKFGELILFLLVESILKAPMIAHKIRGIYPNDQVKGSDGIFIGFYNNFSALFLGESKIIQNYPRGITESLISLDRFHGHESSAKNLNHDLLIAKNTISKDLSSSELNFIYNSLDPTTTEFINNILVHPVLIIYNEKEIDRCEKKAKDNKSAEELLAKYIVDKVPEFEKQIVEKLQGKYAEFEKVYLDFFFIPVKNVSNFRHTLFEAIHGVKYQEKK